MINDSRLTLVSNFGYAVRGKLDQVVLADAGQFADEPAAHEAVWAEMEGAKSVYWIADFVYGVQWEEYWEEED